MKHPVSDRFAVTRSGRLLHADWSSVTCSRAAAQSLHDAIAADFGRAAARKVLNMICTGPRQLGPVYEVGTLARMARLADVIAAHGRYVPGLGFQAYADEPARLGLVAAE